MRIWGHRDLDNGVQYFSNCWSIRDGGSTPSRSTSWRRSSNKSTDSVLWVTWGEVLGKDCVRPSGIGPSGFDPSGFDPSGFDPSGFDPSRIPWVPPNQGIHPFVLTRFSLSRQNSSRWSSRSKSRWSQSSSSTDLLTSVKEWTELKINKYWAAGSQHNSIYFKHCIYFNFNDNLQKYTALQKQSTKSTNIMPWESASPFYLITFDILQFLRERCYFAIMKWNDISCNCLANASLYQSQKNIWIQKNFQPS